ncbi:guanylate kinase [Lactobacillus sp. DCY120]|uniref:Guanylate kinase n=1 Tax=Bombilactobacillus apium TaxID=2675299 RepID=A0A850R210_9LACO|nr:guanylate kinase [Bombilactobacillus apium]NVY97169.1 guanylate kinase [Bombilactobacillus apium]
MKKIIVLTGASGSGKTRVSHYLTQEYQIPAVVTHTTRPQRTGEVEGQDYYFETSTTFATNDYLECVSYAGYQYGSSRQGLLRAWQKQDLVSIVLDTAGASRYLAEFGEQVILIFVTTSLATLEKRLAQRGDDPVVIQARLQSSEFQRDLQLPADLRARAQIVNNEDWIKTSQQIDQIIEPFKKK